MSVKDWHRATGFYRDAFGTEELYRAEGGGVGRLAVGVQDFWVAEECMPNKNFSPESLGGCSVCMLLIQEDPFAVCKQGVAVGAKLIAPVADQYCWRLGRIVDPFGYHCEIGGKVE